MTASWEREAAYGTPGRARAQLKAIRLMRPFPHLVTADEVKRLNMFGGLECWKRVSGNGDGAWFELINTEG